MEMLQCRPRGHRSKQEPSSASKRFSLLSVGSPRERTILLPLPRFPTSRAKAGRWSVEPLQSRACHSGARKCRSDDRLPGLDLREI